MRFRAQSATKMSMGLLSIEHSQVAYNADFAAYGISILAIAVFLILAAPPELSVALLISAIFGAGLWSGLEYLLHRYVLHGLKPFCLWHAQHHARPMALIGSPTVLSATLFAVLVFAPLWAMVNVWLALALTMGLMMGYLAFGLTHHAMHHSRSRNTWLARRKRWHAVHHHSPSRKPHCYGVTSSFWDHVFGTTRKDPAET